MYCVLEIQMSACLDLTVVKFGSRVSIFSECVRKFLPVTLWSAYKN